MSRLRIFAVRLLNLFRRGPFERELDAELQAYLELDVDENIRRGMDPKEARRTALARLGGREMTALKEQCRDVHRFRALDDLWRDLLFGFRRLQARPVLAVVAVAVLAIGIGANTAIFTLLDALLLRPLPGADPHRLAVVSTSDFSSGRPSANAVDPGRRRPGRGRDRLRRHRRLLRRSRRATGRGPHHRPRRRPPGGRAGGDDQPSVPAAPLRPGMRRRSARSSASMTFPPPSWGCSRPATPASAGRTPPPPTCTCHSPPCPCRNATTAWRTGRCGGSRSWGG